jgi:hypothetical protein
VGWLSGTDLNIAEEPLDSTSPWPVTTLSSPEAGRLALVVESSGRLAGVVGLRPVVESSSGDIEIGEPIFEPQESGTLFATAATVGSAGRAVVFFTVDDITVVGNRIWRGERHADGTWTAEDIAANPGGYGAEILPFSENALLVVSTQDQFGFFPLHYVHRDGDTWSSEVATETSVTRGITIAGGDATPTIAHGVDAVYMTSRIGGAWTNEFSFVNRFGNFRKCGGSEDSGCGCSLRDRPRKAAALLLVLALVPAIVVFSRRAKTSP